jgi:hypothetical protein
MGKAQMISYEPRLRPPLDTSYIHHTKKTTIIHQPLAGPAGVVRMYTLPVCYSFPRYDASLTDPIGIGEERVGATMRNNGVHPFFYLFMVKFNFFIF